MPHCKDKGNYNDHHDITGIIRDSSCVLKTEYNAWECHGLDYEMLVVESLDSDTETRRLSPIALFSDGYVDLINGPQDHGWCHGYTCQKRLSTFPLLVATGLLKYVDFTKLLFSLFPKKRIP